MLISSFQASVRAVRKPERARGFSMLEILVAISVLIIGLTGIASLVGQTLGNTETSRYMSLATTLASEKLEDLNRWPATTPPVAYLAAGGSLTSDVASGSVNYYDDVDMSNTTGSVSETISSTTSGTTTYTSLIHNSTGYVNSDSDTSAPSGTGIVSFHRRWLIEADPVVNGITLTGSRRITVLVTLTNSVVQNNVSFQMSLIRQ